MYTLQQNTCAVDDTWGAASAGDIASSAGEQAQISLLTTGSSPIAAAVNGAPGATVPSIFNGSIGQAALQQLQEQAGKLPVYSPVGSGPISAQGGLLNASDNAYIFAAHRIVQANPPRYHWYFEGFETGADCGGYATPWAGAKSDNTMTAALIALALAAAAVVA